MPRTKSEEKMVLISVHIPRRMLEGLDELARSGLFPSRSEAIRVAVRDLLIKERGGGRGVGLGGRLGRWWVGGLRHAH